MKKLTPSMRLKVKRDTFFLPDPEGSVYFRNNVGSFRMEGSMIDRWVEQLLPMFNGEHTLEELTDGLPDEYRDRVMDIADSLFQNGFVQDVSLDRSHSLTDKILERFGSQIEFLSHVADSGAYRFSCYRQSKVAAVGAGPILASLAAALLDSGLSHFHVLLTDSMETDERRFEELVAFARKTDSDAAIEVRRVEQRGVEAWREAVQSFEAILYVSQTGSLEELQMIQAACQEEKKAFLPAICLEQAGLAGPLVTPGSNGSWQSAWRRLHQEAIKKDPNHHCFSVTAGAMLANVIAFELFKTATEVVDSELKEKVFLLNLETLEGSWHSFLPHPAKTGKPQLNWTEQVEVLLEQKDEKPAASKGLMSYFSELTSPETGVFHLWEEGESIQLPLSQCLLQVANPLSNGPAELLPEKVCSGMTHEEARKEAGLAGIEAYVSQWIAEAVPGEKIGIGAGETVEEALARAIQHCLSKEWEALLETENSVVRQIQLGEIEDAHCQFYMKALTTLRDQPKVGQGAFVHGFPVVWVGIREGWFGSVGLNVTFALRKALQAALLQVQNDWGQLPATASRVLWEEQEPELYKIPACAEDDQQEVLRSALQTLQQHGKRLVWCDAAVEPFLKEELAGVCGVMLREEEV